MCFSSKRRVAYRYSFFFKLSHCDVGGWCVIHEMRKIDEIYFETIWLAGPKVAKKAQIMERPRISSVGSHG